MDEKVRKGEICPHCGRYYSRYVVTDGLIINDGKILLIKRGIEPFKGVWALVGGYIDWNETVEEGIIREAKEEVGIDVEIDKSLGVYSDPKRDPDGRQNVAVVFILRPKSLDIKISQEEVLEARWFDLDALPTPIAFDHDVMIEDYKKLASGIGE